MQNRPIEMFHVSGWLISLNQLWLKKREIILVTQFNCFCFCSQTFAVNDDDGAGWQYGVGIKQISHLLMDYHPHSYFRVKQTFAGMVDAFRQQF